MPVLRCRAWLGTLSVLLHEGYEQDERPTRPRGWADDGDQADPDDFGISPDAFAAKARFCFTALSPLTRRALRPANRRSPARIR